SSDGQFIDKWGSMGTGNGQFNSPQGIAVDSVGDVYVTDTGNYRVEKFTSTGQFITKFGTLGTNNGQFGAPSGIVVDSSGDVYVSDASEDHPNIQKFSISNSTANTAKSTVPEFGATTLFALTAAIVSLVIFTRKTSGKI
ncbi:MAG: PEFG-CTERM sorting domain-containing protein, partial [Thaumarchaeota archaeon]|nr:PEFG-CTERM sorting domain-containing protein [Nitrososphaerota archaeon]